MSNQTDFSTDQRGNIPSPPTTTSIYDVALARLPISVNKSLLNPTPGAYWFEQLDQINRMGGFTIILYP